jgi:hypothetical protein
MYSQRYLSLLALFLVSCFCLQDHEVKAFAPSSTAGLQPARRWSTQTSNTGTTSLLKVGNILGGLFGQQEQGPKVVINLPASAVKIGALKFFLSIYLVGEQNKPVKGAWVLSNNDSGGTLDMYYQDGSGMFTVGLEDYGIQVTRYGGKPSLQYMLQESLMLHGILDELHTIAFETDDIEEEKRLLQFSDPETISKAREALPARKAA